MNMTVEHVRAFRLFSMEVRDHESDTLRVFLGDYCEWFEQIEEGPLLPVTDETLSDELDDLLVYERGYNLQKD